LLKVVLIFIIGTNDLKVQHSITFLECI